MNLEGSRAVAGLLAWSRPWKSHEISMKNRVSSLSEAFQRWRRPCGKVVFLNQQGASRPLWP